MALIKRKTRKRLTKDLTKLVKKHGAEMSLALVTSIISGLAADRAAKKQKKARADETPARPVKSARLVRPADRPVVVRKRAEGLTR
jgi:hypothetical protein